MSTLRRPELVALFESVLPQGATRREMGGSPAAMVNGNVFMRLRRLQFVLRLNEADRARMLALPGATVFEAIPGRPMAEYVVVPLEVLADEQSLHGWVSRSFAYSGGLAVQAASGLPKAQPQRQSANTVQIPAMKG